MRVKEVKILPVGNGYIVTVGCTVMVMESTARLLSELKRYLENPKEVEKEYIDKCGLNPVQVPENPNGNADSRLICAIRKITKEYFKDEERERLELRNFPPGVAQGAKGRTL